jgi:hypothetical protein
LFVEGGLDAQTHKFESAVGDRTLGVGRHIKRHAHPECLGVCIEEQFSGQLSSVKALFPMLGTAIQAFELEGLPWATIHLAKLNIHATVRATK